MINLRVRELLKEKKIEEAITQLADELDEIKNQINNMGDEDGK